MAFEKLLHLFAKHTGIVKLPPYYVKYYCIPKLNVCN